LADANDLIVDRVRSQFQFDAWTTREGIVSNGEFKGMPTDTSKGPPTALREDRSNKRKEAGKTNPKRSRTTETKLQRQRDVLGSGGAIGTSTMNALGALWNFQEEGATTNVSTESTDQSTWADPFQDVDFTQFKDVDQVHSFVELACSQLCTTGSPSFAQVAFTEAAIVRGENAMKANAMKARTVVLSPDVLSSDVAEFEYIDMDQFIDDKVYMDLADRVITGLGRDKKSEATLFDGDLKQLKRGRMLFGSHADICSSALQASHPLVHGLQSVSLAQGDNWWLYELVPTCAAFIAGKTCAQVHHQDGHYTGSFGIERTVYFVCSLNRAPCRDVMAQLARLYTNPLHSEVEVVQLRLHPQEFLECLIRVALCLSLVCKGASPEEIAYTKPVDLKTQYEAFEKSTLAGRVVLPVAGNFPHSGGHVLRTFNVTHGYSTAAISAVVVKVAEAADTQRQRRSTRTTAGVHTGAVASAAKAQAAAKPSARKRPSIDYITSLDLFNSKLLAYKERMESGELAKIIFFDSEWNKMKRAAKDGVDVSQFGFADGGVIVAHISLLGLPKSASGKIELPPTMVSVLESEDFLKIGSYLTQVDCGRLLAGHNVVVSNADNLHQLIPRLMAKPLSSTKGSRGLDALYARFVPEGPELKKSTKTARSDWSTKLTKEQQGYAADDVLALKRIYDAVTAKYPAKREPRRELDGELAQQASDVASLLGACAIREAEL
jgi:hypothetical protein